VTACPFVAFVDDRDERADVPDHRHRCYAEIRPAPRAIAHQQTYCLSSAFAACPTFQDWARREAARARGSNGGPAPDHAEIVDLDPVPVVAATASEAVGDGLPDPEPQDLPFDDRAERNPHRDWADPPPWSDPDAAATSVPADAPPFLATRPPGPHGDEVVAAAGLSASRWIQDVPTPRTPDGAGAPDKDPDDELERALAEDRANRERSAALAGASATASSSRAARRAVPPATPQKVSQARRTPPGRDVTGPAWERPRRFEAYPTLKTRIGLPSIPRVGLAALAVIVAAIVLFSVPFVFRFGGGGDQGGGGAVASPSPSSGSGALASPTEAPAPTAQVYVIKAGDTLLKIAKKYKLTMDQLLAANKKIKNPNKISVGDEIVIPVAPPTEVVDGASGVPGSAEPASAAP
jgi:nucleoid-associated protein YgaU